MKHMKHMKHIKLYEDYLNELNKETYLSAADKIETYSKKKANLFRNHSDFSNIKKSQNNKIKKLGLNHVDYRKLIELENFLWEHHNYDDNSKEYADLVKSETHGFKFNNLDNIIWSTAKFKYLQTYEGLTKILKGKSKEQVINSIKEQDLTFDEVIDKIQNYNYNTGTNMNSDILLGIYNEDEIKNKIKEILLEPDIDYVEILTNSPKLKDITKMVYYENIIDYYNNWLKYEDIRFEKDNDNYKIFFNSWENFSNMFKVDNDKRSDLFSLILSGMGNELFMYNTLKYDGDENVDDNTLNELKEKIINHIINNDSDENINEVNNLDNLYEIYDFCKENGLDEFKDLIDLAYTRSQELADESLAYEEMTDAIINKFNIDKDTIEWFDNNEMVAKNTDIFIIDFDDFLNKLYDYDSDYVKYFMIDYDVPYYGYNGTIDEDILSEELFIKLDDIP